MHVSALRRIGALTERAPLSNLVLTPHLIRAMSSSDEPTSSGSSASGRAEPVPRRPPNIECVPTPSFPPSKNPDVTADRSSKACLFFSASLAEQAL